MGTKGIIFTRESELLSARNEAKAARAIRTRITHKVSTTTNLLVLILFKTSFNKSPQLRTVSTQYVVKSKP